MAARKPIEIVLGPDRYKIRPLTINQVESLEKLVQEAGSSEATVALARGVIGIGLSRDHTAIDVGEAEATVEEMAQAMASILRQGGFIPALPGEAQAAA